MKPKVAIVVTTAFIVRVFLYDQIRAISKYCAVTVITTSESSALLDILPDEVEFQSIDIKREISLFSDIVTLFKLYKIFRDGKYMLVHTVTPKAGLLGMLSARLTFVPHRIHTFTGQVWATRRGIMRFLLKMMDKLIVLCASSILIDSNAQRNYLIEQKVVTMNKSMVFGSGSISGVDSNRFYSDPKLRASTRSELGCIQSATIILYLGRLKYDKGIIDLARAFTEVIKKNPQSVLLLVGPDEEGLKPEICTILQHHMDSVIFIPYTKTPETYMNAADIFCLPSYREGFGSVVIEAASCGVPSVVSRIYGLQDSIDENNTGLFFTPGCINDLVNAICLLAGDCKARFRMAEMAKKRAINDFSQKKITQQYLNYYSVLLGFDV